MENKEEGQKRQKGFNKFNKRVSLFKRRKKPKVRALVKEHKHRDYKKLIINITLLVIVIFIISAALYIVRFAFFQNYMMGQQELVTPQGSPGMDDNQIENIILNKGINLSNVRISTVSSAITFNLEENIQVIITKEKNIDSQLELVEAISRQLKRDGKRAVYIDLRYNKPIVKTQ